MPPCAPSSKIRTSNSWWRTLRYLDRTFNLVDYLQSRDRIHRLSQTRNCEIVLLLAKDSIDEFVDFCLEQKTRLARFVQQDADDILPADAALEKPDILRALLWPEEEPQEQ